jgi:protein ImuB
LCFEETLELEDALELLEPLSFLLNRLLEQLIERLIARALATSKLRLTLTLESHPDVELARGPQPQSQLEYTCAFKLPVPTQDPKLLLKLVQLELSAHPPAAAVKKILVKAEPAHPRAAQAGLFLPAAPEPEKLEVLLARLRATVGDRDQQGRALVGSPRLPDSHRPDGFEMAAFSPPAGDGNSAAPPSPRMALRRFRPPLPAQVEAREHVPQAVKFREQNFTVLAAAGPWRSSGEWWSASGWQREEWDVALAMKEGQGIYRIAWDAKVESWFVEGLYD